MQINSARARLGAKGAWVTVNALLTRWVRLFWPQLQGWRADQTSTFPRPNLIADRTLLPSSRRCFEP